MALDGMDSSVIADDRAGGLLARAVRSVARQLLPRDPVPGVRRRRPATTSSGVVEPLEGRVLLSTTQLWSANDGPLDEGLSVSYEASGTPRVNTTDWNTGATVLGTSVSMTVSGLPTHTMLYAPLTVYHSANGSPFDPSGGDTIVYTIGDHTQTWHYYWANGASHLDVTGDHLGWMTHTGGDLTITVSWGDGEMSQDALGWSLDLYAYQPTVSLSGSGTVVEDGTGAATFTVSRDLPTYWSTLPATGRDDVAATVVSLVDAGGGTATSGVDYQALPTSLTIPTNATASTPYSVVPYADLSNEGSESVFASVGSPANGAIYELAATPATPPSTNATTQVVHITDSVLPVVAVSAVDNRASENGQDEAKIRFSRSGDTSSSLTVSYSLGGSATPGTIGSGGVPSPSNADYTGAGSGTGTRSITIPSGEGYVDLVLTPLNDSAVEGVETITVTVEPAPGYVLAAGPGTTQASTTQATLHDLQIAELTGRPTNGDLEALVVLMGDPVAGVRTNAQSQLLAHANNYPSVVAYLEGIYPTAEENFGPEVSQRILNILHQVGPFRVQFDGNTLQALVRGTIPQDVSYGVSISPDAGAFFTASMAGATGVVILDPGETTVPIVTIVPTQVTDAAPGGVVAEISFILKVYRLDPGTGQWVWNPATDPERTSVIKFRIMEV